MGSVAFRYWLAQVPGWGVTALVLAGAWRLLGLPGWAVLAGIALVVVKDVALYPMSKRALESRPHAGSGAMVGKRGVADARMEQGAEGRIRIGPEIWRAVLAPDAAPVEAGSRVRVASVDGLLLRIHPE
jgi:membrane protein implicated in regulation of membrane protease activity